MKPARVRFWAVPIVELSCSDSVFTVGRSLWNTHGRQQVEPYCMTRSHK